MQTKETRHTRYIICPFCEYENKDSWEVDFGPGIEGNTEVYCDSCGKPFMVSRTVDVTYTSTVKKEDVKP